MDAHTNFLKLKWSRPQTAGYPKIWKTFFARDTNTENLVEYRIEDLPESRFDEAIEHMVANYLKDEPMTYALNGSNDEQHIADYCLGWRSILAQKTVLVCIKADSKEFVGVNFNFVISKGDDFFKHFRDRVSICELNRESEITYLMPVVAVKERNLEANDLIKSCTKIKCKLLPYRIFDQIYG